VLSECVCMCVCMYVCMYEDIQTILCNCVFV
jgi:hypothetical protein